MGGESGWVDKSRVTEPYREVSPGKRVDVLQENTPIDLNVPEIKVPGGKLELETCLLKMPEIGNVAQIAFRGISGRVKQIELDSDPGVCANQYGEIKRALQDGNYRVEITSKDLLI